MCIYNDSTQSRVKTGLYCQMTDSDTLPFSFHNQRNRARFVWKDPLLFLPHTSRPVLPVTITHTSQMLKLVVTMQKKAQPGKGTKTRRVMLFAH